MQDDQLPAETRRDLSALLVRGLERAGAKACRLIRHLRRHTDPPADIEVRSILGHHYTGLVLVEGNEVIWGVVVRTGNAVTPRSEPPPVLRPHEPTYREDDPSLFLRGWADNPREDGEPW